jgi:hypothetical protein
MKHTSFVIMFQFLEDWKNDEFGSVPGYYETDKKNYDSRIEYIKIFKNQWKKINIYEYYDGYQITLTTSNTEKKVLVYSNSYDALQRVMNIVYNMNNLEEFCFNSRFIKEYPDGLFKEPIKSVKIVRTVSEHIIHRDFIKEKQFILITR